MSNQKKRWGGKLGGTHSTVIEAGWRLLPGLIKEDLITKISPGFITAGKNSTGRSSLKIKVLKGCLMLSVRGASSHQEIRVFSKDIDGAKKLIARVAEEAGFHVSQ